LAYANYINLLGDNMNTIKDDIEAILGASKDAGLEMNAEKTKYMIMSGH